jgi:predicted glycoside hydrolase/deacetylase ChbG (UPF0249 family)
VSGRHLIVNADDFGRSRSINAGVIEAHERGIASSASLMVRWPAADEAAGYARENGALSLGLHVDAGEWVWRRGRWAPVYEVKGEPTEIVAWQLDRFRELVGRDPTHLDSHQHRHREEPWRSILLDAAAALGVPLRDFSKLVRYCGDFYGQAEDGTPFPRGISVERMLAILASLQPGVTELGCHPGAKGALASAYRDERPRELKTLCDPRVRAALVDEGIELRSFVELL